MNRMPENSNQQRDKNDTGEEITAPRFLSVVDKPKAGKVFDENILIRGWLVPLNNLVTLGIRARIGSQTYKLSFGEERPDVARAFPDLENEKTLRSGFSAEIKAASGHLYLEVDLGEGYEQFFEIELQCITEKLPSDIYNPLLSNNWPEHINLLESKKMYFFEEDNGLEFVRAKNDPKAVAFYLPQFHPIPENDKAWGKGFTDWTNVASAQPRFVGHYQPMLPRDLGFYDLRLEEVIAAQINLAKRGGLYGFCFYYYWFSGKHLLERPLKSFLAHKDWDFNFMICWANENWTKRWDGYDKEIIVAQRYFPDDPHNFIKDVEDILLDPRYIRVDGKPVLAVYRASELRVPSEYARKWREYFKKKHNLEIYLLSILSFSNQDPREYGFDAGIDFVPQAVSMRDYSFENNIPPLVDIKDRQLDTLFEGSILDYRRVALSKKFHELYEFPTLRCLMPSWDNDARRKGKGTAFYYCNPDLYSKWLDTTISKNKGESSSLFFINAWNEWGEGTTLEPTLHYGHAFLRRTAEVLAKHSRAKINQRRFSPYGLSRNPETKLAVIVHIYYPEMWAKINKRLNNIDTRWDLFVTITPKDRSLEAEIKSDYPDAHIYTVPNRGRDILPFVHLSRRLQAVGYKYVLKLHTKKSDHRIDGERWFNELLSGLLPNKKNVDRILSALDDEGAGLVGPKGHYIDLASYMGRNRKYLRHLLEEIVKQNDIELPLNSNVKAAFFAGSMYWASLKTLKPLLNLYLMPEDFESENGQVDGTMAHAVERLIGLLPLVDGSDIYNSSRWGIKKVSPDRGLKNYKYAVRTG